MLGPASLAALTSAISGAGTLKLALSIGDPSFDGSTLVEPTSGYARQTITVVISDVAGGGKKLTSTNGLIFGPVVSAPWGSITHGVLMDASGNIFASGPLAAVKNPPVGDTISFGIGAVQFVFR